MYHNVRQITKVNLNTINRNVSWEIAKKIIKKRIKIKFHGIEIIVYHKIILMRDVKWNHTIFFWSYVLNCFIDY